MIEVYFNPEEFKFTNINTKVSQFLENLDYH